MDTLRARKVADAGRRWLNATHNTTLIKAIVLDVDDTTLMTWNYEVFSNWAFNPGTNADFVLNQRFPAVFGMVDMVNEAAKEGYAVIFLTGRGEDGLFTKPTVAHYPPYLQAACAGDPNGSCTTIHYKSATRSHIESLGYEIVANFGDQFSDLEGGHADRTFEMPNPNYFLP